MRNIQLLLLITGIRSLVTALGLYHFCNFVRSVRLPSRPATDSENATFVELIL